MIVYQIVLIKVDNETIGDSRERFAGKNVYNDEFQNPE